MRQKSLCTIISETPSRNYSQLNGGLWLWILSPLVARSGAGSESAREHRWSSIRLDWNLNNNDNECFKCKVSGSPGSPSKNLVLNALDVCLPWYEIKEVFFIVEQIRFISLLNGFYLSTPFCIVVFLSLTWSGECPPSLLEVFSFAFAFALASGVILITWTGFPILMIRSIYNYTLRVQVTAVE